MTSFERYRRLSQAAGRAMRRVFDVMLGVAPKPQPMAWDTMLAKGVHVWGKYNDVHRHCAGCTDPIPTPPETPRLPIREALLTLRTPDEWYVWLWGDAGLRGHTPSVAIGDGHA